MIIITGTFRNTSNPLKLYEITLFHTGSSVYYSVYESEELSLCWWRINFRVIFDDVKIIFFSIIWRITNEGCLVNYSSQILLVSNKIFNTYSTINTCLVLNKRKITTSNNVFRFSSTPIFVRHILKNFSILCMFNCSWYLRRKYSMVSRSPHSQYWVLFTQNLFPHQHDQVWTLAPCHSRLNQLSL